MKNKMTEEEVIEREIKLLQSFPWVSAYTGELGKTKQGSYVEMFEITKAIGRRRQELKRIKEMKYKMKKRKP